RFSRAWSSDVCSSDLDDRRAQLNLAAVYQQAGMQDKSLAVLEKLRTGGQLTEAVEYQQLYTTYINMEGKEAEAIAVINEGVDKRSEERRVGKEYRSAW